MLQNEGEVADSSDIVFMFHTFLVRGIGALHTADDVAVAWLGSLCIS